MNHPCANSSHFASHDDPPHVEPKIITLCRCFPVQCSIRFTGCGSAASLQNHLGHLCRTLLKRKLAKFALHRNDSSLDFSTLQFFAFLTFAFFRIHGSCVVRCCGVCIRCFEVLRPLGFRVVDVLSSCRKLGFSHFEILGKGARRLPP